MNKSRDSNSTAYSNMKSYEQEQRLELYSTAYSNMKSEQRLELYGLLEHEIL